MDNIVRGKLKLKTGSAIKVSSKNHKKKKSKKSKKKSSKSDEHLEGQKEEEEEVRLEINTMTDAQRRHEEVKKKREEEEIKRIASKTYRERVEEMNQYLGSLTEHHDVPRVSAAGNG